MNLLSWIGRGALALLGLLLAADIGAVIFRVWDGALAVGAIQATFLVLGRVDFCLDRRNRLVPAGGREARVPRPGRSLDANTHWVLAAQLWFAHPGAWLLSLVDGHTALEVFQIPPAWLLTGICAAFFAFHVVGPRISLGSLWSGSVSRKESHALVQSGPYRVVRHPIYTGLIVAASRWRIQIGMLNNLLGAALMAFGFWLKARLEERFLSIELGSDAYAAFRQRTPMLVPFWPR